MGGLLGSVVVFWGGICLFFGWGGCPSLSLFLSRLSLREMRNYSMEGTITISNPMGLFCVHRTSVLMTSKIKVMSWNVRGLGDKKKRQAVLESIEFHKSAIVCLHETHLGSEDSIFKFKTVQRILL